MGTPVFKKPAPLGFGAALTSATYVASPLLAGFSVAAIGLISTSQKSFRWPGVSLLLFTMATVFLVASLQFGIICQKYFYSRSELSNWWTEDEYKSHLSLFSGEQQADFNSWKKHGWKALLSYNLGIAVLGAALVTLLYPLPNEHGALEATKLASVALMGLATVATFIYGVITSIQVGGMIQSEPDKN